MTRCDVRDWIEMTGEVLTGVLDRADSGTSWRPACMLRDRGRTLSRVTDDAGSSVEHSLQLVSDRPQCRCMDCIALQ